MAAKLIALVLPLGLDTFAVSAALGSLGAAAGRRRHRISMLFMAFEAGMPLIGLALGAPLGHAIGKAADYVATGVVLALGLYMLLGPNGTEGRVSKLLELRGSGAVLLAISISLDEFAIGFTLGVLRLPVGLVIALIALQAFVASQLGLCIGDRVNESLREGAERLAGAALTTLGVALLAQKLLS